MHDRVRMRRGAGRDGGTEGGRGGARGERESNSNYDCANLKKACKHDKKEGHVMMTKKRRVMMTKKK